MQSLVSQLQGRTSWKKVLQRNNSQKTERERRAREKLSSAGANAQGPPSASHTDLPTIAASSPFKLLTHQMDGAQALLTQSLPQSPTCEPGCPGDLLFPPMIFSGNIPDPNHNEDEIKILGNPFAFARYVESTQQM